MKIALIGYGKMGHMIEQIALLRGHNIVCVIDKDDQYKFNSDEFKSADVAIEFSTPLTAEQNIRNAWAAGVPVVCGTTGWDAQALIVESRKSGQSPKVERAGNKTMVVDENGKVMLVWSSNFSVGVNIFFDLNKWLAEVIRHYPQYKPHIYEEHHIHKLDKPSGTAKTLRNDILSVAAPLNGDASLNDVPIESVREGEIPGNHSVIWDSPEDTIVITHMAKGREGFALGAVLAAEKLTALERIDDR